MDPSQTTKAVANGDVVSFDNEALIIVDAQDRILGHGTKAELHQGAGTLHRAFSIFLFDDAGHVLLQKRSADKPLWPGFWSNTCCSHPRRGESYGIATRRRLKEELGVEAPLRFTHRFRYQAQFSAEGAEHELCSVYVGRIDGDPMPNPQEVSDWQWVSPSALDEWLDTNPE
ncbi:MAG: isopentenyl-diphosphate Delta-isomerase, partial [Luminiphilus sp.]